MDLTASLGVHPGRHDVGDVPFALSLAHGLETGLHPQAGDAAGLPQPPHLFRRLDTTRGPHDFPAIDPANPGQGGPNAIEAFHRQPHAEVGAQLGGDMGPAQAQLPQPGRRRLHQTVADAAGIESYWKVPSDHGLHPGGLGLNLASLGAENGWRQVLPSGDEGHVEVGGHDPAHFIKSGGIAYVGLLGQQQSVDSRPLHLFPEPFQAPFKLLPAAVGKKSASLLAGDLQAVAHGLSLETGCKGGRRKGRDAAGGTPESQVMSRVTSRATGADKRWAFLTEAATLDTSCSSWR